MSTTEHASEDRALLDKKERAQENAERTREKDLQKILSLAEGRRYLWYLLSKTGLYETSFATHSNQMAFNEGERNVGLRLQKEIMEADAEAHLKMINEEKKYD